MADQQMQHLLRRAGFGSSPHELSHYSEMSYSGAVDALLNYEQIPDDVDSKIGTPGYVGVTAQGPFQPNTNINHARQRWLFRMVHSQRPLQEKMTLFWHNHFATGYTKVQGGSGGGPDGTRLMAAKPSEDPAQQLGQIELFRNFALGNFKDLLVEVSKDPRRRFGSTGARTRKTSRRKTSAAKSWSCSRWAWALHRGRRVRGRESVHRVELQRHRRAR